MHKKVIKVLEFGCLCSTLAIDYESMWNRAPAPALDPSVDPLVFQQIEIDEYIGSSPPQFPIPRQLPSTTIIRMYGVTKV